MSKLCTKNNRLGGFSFFTLCFPLSRSDVRPPTLVAAMVAIAPFHYV